MFCHFWSQWPSQDVHQFYFVLQKNLFLCFGWNPSELQVQFLCPDSDVVLVSPEQVVVRLGRQRWRIRGRIQSDDSQSWDEEEMVFLPHISQDFEIKVGGSNETRAEKKMSKYMKNIKIWRSRTKLNLHDWMNQKCWVLTPGLKFSSLSVSVIFRLFPHAGVSR